MAHLYSGLPCNNIVETECLILFGDSNYCTAKRSYESVLKEISPEYSLEGLMLKLKLQYFGHLMQRKDSLEKTLMLRKIEHVTSEKVKIGSDRESKICLSIFQAGGSRH